MPDHPQTRIRICHCGIKGCPEHIEVDQDIAELLTVMNKAGVHTTLSCQDSNLGIGTVRRVWIQIYADCLHGLLARLDKPAELDDLESLSCRMAPEFYPDGDTEAFNADRAWHYRIGVSRQDGEIIADAVDIRFPFTDMPEVIERLRLYA